MKKFIILLLLITVSPVSPAWGVETIPMTPQMKTDLFKSLSNKLACLCGCGTTLIACPHDSCSFAIPTRKAITKMIDNGMSSKQIVAQLVSTRGERILAAPSFSGFNLVAWLTPYIAIIIVGTGIIVLLRTWVGKQKLAAASQSPSDGAIEDTIDENDPQYKRLHDELEQFES